MGLLDASCSSSSSSCICLSLLLTSHMSLVFCLRCHCCSPCCLYPCCMCCKLKPWGLASCGLASSLFGSCHDNVFMRIMCAVLLFWWKGGVATTFLVQSLLFWYRSTYMKIFHHLRWRQFDGIFFCVHSEQFGAKFSEWTQK